MEMLLTLIRLKWKIELILFLFCRKQEGIQLAESAESVRLLIADAQARRRSHVGRRSLLPTQFQGTKSFCHAEAFQGTFHQDLRHHQQQQWQQHDEDGTVSIGVEGGRHSRDLSSAGSISGFASIWVRWRPLPESGNGF